MKLNNKGLIDHTLLIVLAVVVIVAGFVLWRLQQTDETVSNTEMDRQLGHATVNATEMDRQLGRATLIKTEINGSAKVTSEC